MSKAKRAARAQKAGKAAKVETIGGLKGARKNYTSCFDVNAGRARPLRRG